MSDIDFLVDLWSDPVVTLCMGGPREKNWLRTVFQETARASEAERFVLWPLLERETGRLVGHCGLLGRGAQGLRNGLPERW